MAEVQGLFEKFHSTIRTDYDINSTLREKKDIIVRRVKAHLADIGKPTCDEYLQGSYKMKVGICALEGSEFDIDVGLRFSFSETRYTPQEVRSWVYEAVDGHTDTAVGDKGPCLRVTYADGYHVDLVCYAWWDDAWSQTQYRLAHKSNSWLPADPPKLIEWVNDARAAFDNTKDSATQTDQFRRVVRYLKRWNDEAIRGESDDKPSGLAMVLLTAQHLTFPALDWAGKADDRKALEKVAEGAAATYGRIIAKKPTPEYEDMFGRLSDKAMTALKERFAALRDALRVAKQTDDVSVACKELKRVLGDDFPCPPKSDAEQQTAMRTRSPAIIPSSNSA